MTGRDPSSALEWSLAPPPNTLGPSGFPVLLTHSLPDPAQGRVPLFCQAWWLRLSRESPTAAAGGSGTSPIPWLPRLQYGWQERLGSPSSYCLLPLALNFNNSSDHRVRADLSEAGGWASLMIALPTSRLTSGQLMVTTS